MDIHSIQQANSAYQKAQSAKSVSEKANPSVKQDVKEKEVSNKSNEPAAVYEKSAIVEQMKLDVEQRTAQLQDLVRNMMYTQAGVSENGDDIWKVLASGK